MKLSYKYFTFNVPLCLLRWLKRRMRWVRAAGGIVTSDEGRMLLIFRNGRWDLPKGKVEAGETLMRAAVREVQEETGLVRLQAGRLVTKTYHVYNLYGGWHLKQTSWFRMTTEGFAPETHPQSEEGITACNWVDGQEWFRRLQRSYGTLRLLSRKVWKE